MCLDRTNRLRHQTLNRVLGASPRAFFLTAEAQLAEPVVVLVSDPNLVRKLGARELRPASRRKIVAAKASDIIFVGGEQPLTWPIDERVLAEVALDQTIARCAAVARRLARAAAKGSKPKVVTRPKRRSDPA